MREYQSIPRTYELMVLINPEVNDEALTAEIDRIAGIISATGADITQVKRDAPWGRRRLAYPIARFRDATYVIYQFNVAASRVREIERELMLNERVLRHLVVRHEAPPAEEAEAGEPTSAEQPAPATDEPATPEPASEQIEATE